MGKIKSPLGYAEFFLMAKMLHESTNKPETELWLKAICSACVMSV